MAFEDFQTANRLSPCPTTRACLGYCLSRLDQWDAAAVCYQDALNGGFVSPGLLNNLGFSYLRLNRLDAAEQYLSRAVAADERLAASYHALVLVGIDRAKQRGEVPPSAMDWARKAIEAGPDSADLHRQVAMLYALGAKREPAKAASAIEHLARAIQLGLDPKTLQGNPVFAVFQGRTDYEELLSNGRPVASPSVRADFLVDPLPPGSL
jgi:tetratricopeptide (TPR) repeat protein